MTHSNFNLANLEKKAMKTKLTGKNYNKAVEIIKNGAFEDYSISEDWFILFSDENGVQWSVAAAYDGKFSRYYLQVDDVAVVRLGKELSQYIFDFIDDVEAEKRAEKRDYHEYNNYLNSIYHDR